MLVKRRSFGGNFNYIVKELGNSELLFGTFYMNSVGSDFAIPAGEILKK